ncbi:MAG TPA: methyltransferase domain-containing protein, partial [Polyangiaceae bacterium]|nr:methyltransferase domain-containing protein [Polyangiaceae bacterium]
AEQACDTVFCGTTETWTAGAKSEPFDALILSDVLEHTADPLGFLTKLCALPSVRSAVWIVSVPNYAVWYNRVRTLLGRFEYSWSGLYDRTHLRFFTRSSVQRVLEHCGFEVLEDICSPSLAQSAAPVLRRLFSNKLESGDHLALTDSASYGFYSRWIEPVESATCRLWPELLGFQIITAARLRP